MSVDREEAVLQLAQDVFRAAKALVLAAGQVVAAAVAAAAVAARGKRMVVEPVLRFKLLQDFECSLLGLIHYLSPAALMLSAFICCLPKFRQPSRSICRWAWD